MIPKLFDLTLLSFLTHLNSQHPNIHFIMELENNRSVPFFDVLVTRHLGESLSHSILRKPIHIAIDIF